MKVHHPRLTDEDVSRLGEKNGAFSLIEVVVGIALLGFLMVSIYQLAAGAMNIGNAIAETQQEEMHLHAFLKIMRRNIESLPGNAAITMDTPRNLSGYYESEFILENHPMAFSWGGIAAGSTKVLIVTEKDPLGGHRVRIRYLNEEEAEIYDEGSLGINDGLSLVLIDGLRSIKWNFYDLRNDEWVEDWLREGERPTFIELVVEFYDDSTIRSVFWIPVVANPEEVVAGARGGGGSGSRGGGNRPGQPGAGRGDGRGDGRVQGQPGAGQRPGGGARPGGGGGGRPGGAQPGGQAPRGAAPSRPTGGRPGR